MAKPRDGTRTEVVAGELHAGGRVVTEASATHATTGGGAGPVTPPRLIDLSHVSKIYALSDVEVIALDDVSLQVPAGQFLSIMGASGSGKSTLVNVIGCLDRPTSGTYQLARRPVGHLARNELARIRIGGGFVGIAVGVLAANRLAAHFHWPFSIHPEILVIAVGFSAMVGVVFGIYTARKASRLDPIEALRFE